MIDFSPTEEQLQLADAAAALLRSRADLGAADASDATWRALADFGAWGLLTPEGGGGLGDLVALLEALGAGLCPGPVIASTAAGALLSADEAGELASGDLRVTIAVRGALGVYVPWLMPADVVLEIDGDQVWRVAAEPVDRTVETLSGESWPAAQLTRTELLDGSARFVVAAELGLAAALLGAARTLIERGAAHARTREQFGRPIGGFQGVAHPLADAWAEVTAAVELVRLVATEHDQDAAAQDTARARLARDQATRAALQTAYTVHQAMGGLSFAVETGIGALSTRIRQWSLLLADPRAGAAATAVPGAAP